MSAAAPRLLAVASMFLGWVFSAELQADDFPASSSAKGLQVQMVDDALALGVQHATFNVNLAQVVDVHARQPGPQHIAWQYADRTWFFHRSMVENLDHRIRTLSDRGVLVYLILLVYEHADPATNHILLHPDYHPEAPNRLGAFNVVTDEGRQWLAATISFFAHRWSVHSRSDQSSHGRVVGYIVGNEVNSHWFWCNQGEVSMEDFAEDYHTAVRLVHTAVRSAAQWPRVYLSLEHHWNIRYPGGTAHQAFAGRPFLQHFAALARQHGDFDWHVAFHPYPENLGNPRFWNDQTAWQQADSPRVTFRNLSVLTEFLKQDALTFRGMPRRVILSEQGFHTPDDAEGEDVQAAAYCLAWYLVQQNRGIDAFILHRHVDHRDEGGLRLGLWTRHPDTVAAPLRKKRIYDCFQDADTPKWRDTFRFALPIIGRDDWTQNEPE